MKTRAMRSMLVLCVLSAGSSAQPQEPLRHDQTSHPKLGLVLEGGGALGLAHIGVITWMEEHRIPVSYVDRNQHGWSGWRNLRNRPIASRGQRAN